MSGRRAQTGPIGFYKAYVRLMSEGLRDGSTRIIRGWRDLMTHATQVRAEQTLHFLCSYCFAGAVAPRAEILLFGNQDKHHGG